MAIAKAYKTEYLRADLSKNQRLYKHKGLTGEGYITSRKSDDDEEYILFSEKEIKDFIWSLEEQLKDKLEKAKREEENAKVKQKKADEQYENAYRNAVDIYAEEVEGIKANCDKKIEKATKECEKAYNEADIYRKKNENLLRICKEKANAERGLQPKKTHTGYVVMVSRQKTYKWSVIYGSGKKKERVTHEADIWETVIQTPFKVDMDAKTVEEEILRTLFSVENDGKFLSKSIGIDIAVWQKYENLEDNNVNICFNRTLQANYKVGYWEIIIWHTLPLGLVPAEMRAS